MTGRTHWNAQELLRGAAEGDRRAWAELVDRYARTLCVVIRKYGLAGDDLADVGQATWLKLLDNIGQIEKAEELGSWLATTARHESLRRIEEIQERDFREMIRIERTLEAARVRKARIPRVRRHAVSPEQLTNLAVFLAGPGRSSLLNEWRSHLSGETGRGLTRKDQIHAARGFLLAAIRYRLQDAAGLAWRPVDALLGSRALSNLFVMIPTAMVALSILRHEGTLGVLTSAESISAIAAGLYGLVRVGRWWRDVKPPEPKARRAKE